MTAAISSAQQRRVVERILASGETLGTQKHLLTQYLTEITPQKQPTIAERAQEYREQQLRAIAEKKEAEKAEEEARIKAEEKKIQDRRQRAASRLPPNLLAICQASIAQLNEMQSMISARQKEIMNKGRNAVL